MDDSLQVAHGLLADGCEQRLVEALEARLTIGQAVGMLMERHGLDEQQAERLLSDGAERARLTVREHATRLVEACNVEFEPIDRHGWTIRPAALRAGARRGASQVPQKVR